MPGNAIDFTSQQLLLMLQAFGKKKLSKLKKSELSVLLSETMEAGENIVDAQKISQVRKLILGR